jgi:hypothetical protein
MDSRPMHSTGSLGATDSGASTPISLMRSFGDTMDGVAVDHRKTVRISDPKFPSLWAARPPQVTDPLGAAAQRLGELRGGAGELADQIATLEFLP